jgi:CRP-like cAMP-binding protein
MNRLLASIPKKDLRRLMMKCEHIELLLGEVLNHAGDCIKYVYFPTTSIISIMKPIDTNRDLEIGLIGNEGILGCTLLLGVNSAPFFAVVQKTGHALRIQAKTFISELEKSFVLKRRLNLYLYVSFSQHVQTAACNRFHVLEKRLARLLLMIRDRADSQYFHITQESLAKMLGVRRVGVTIAAGNLQHQKLISYSRGDLKIHDNTGLEEKSCSCYEADKLIYDLILS